MRQSDAISPRQVAIRREYTWVLATTAQDLRVSQASWRQAELRTRLASVLATCLIVLGLLNIPVECAVAAGPHSMFLAPDSVAALQSQASNAAAAAASHTSHDRAHDRVASPGAVGSSQVHVEMTAVMDERPGAPVRQPHPAMPTPVGFASDAVPLRMVANPAAGPRFVGPTPLVATWSAPLRDHETAGPEPPPPNLS